MLLKLLWTVLASTLAYGQSVAVTPFANATQDATAAPNVDWIGESIAETLREALAAKGIASVQRDDIEEAYKRLRLRHVELSQASLLKMAEAVDAEHLMFGSFTFLPAAPGGESKGSLRITARMVDRRRLKSSAELTEEGPLEDLAKLEAHLSWQALMQLGPKQSPAEADSASLRLTIRLDAEESYIRGLLASLPEQKEKFFKQAATLEPRFAQPCMQLGLMYFARKQFREAGEWLERVGSSYVRHREAQFFLGLAKYQLNDFAGAERAFRQIAAVVPLSEVLSNLAASESRRQMPQATDDFRKALEGDPTDPDYHFNLGYSLWKRGDFANAADQFRAVLDRKPDDQMATLLLGRCLKKQGLKIGDVRGPDARFQSLERLKLVYEEQAYWQLKSMLDAKPE